MTETKQIDSLTTANLSKVQYILFVFPITIIAGVITLLLITGNWSEEGYVSIQRDCFLWLNSFTPSMSSLMNNLTQLGDAYILLSILSILFLYTPSVWENLISSAIVSGVLSSLLKRLIGIPRPSMCYDLSTFHIIGEQIGGYKSCPSGHSITVFAAITVILLAFMPKGNLSKVVWSLSVVAIGLLIASSRVFVGAHHPLDVILGCAVGFVSSLIGIFINRKYPIWRWIGSIKFYPIFILIFLGGAIGMVVKIAEHSLVVYYITLASLSVSLIYIIKAYVKKDK